MDELMDCRLHNQAQELREAMGIFSQASHRLAGLGGSVGWSGPASLAYNLAIDALRAEFRAAEHHLGEALHDTVSALGSGAHTAEPSCG